MTLVPVPSKINQVVFEISQATFSPLVALFYQKTKTPIKSSFLEVLVKKVCIPTDFGVTISNIQSNF